MWKLTVKLRNPLIATKLTQGPGLPELHIYSTLLPFCIILTFFISNHRLWVGVQVELEKTQTKLELLENYDTTFRKYNEMEHLEIMKLDLDMR